MGDGVEKRLLRKKLECKGLRWYSDNEIRAMSEDEKLQKLALHKIEVIVKMYDHDGKTVKETYELTYHTAWHGQSSTLFELIEETVDGWNDGIAAVVKKTVRVGGEEHG